MKSRQTPIYMYIPIKILEHMLGLGDSCLDIDLLQGQLEKKPTSIEPIFSIGL